MQQYVPLDETIAFILIRTCYNQIRLSHTPYSPDVSPIAQTM